MHIICTQFGASTVGVQTILHAFVDFLGSGIWPIKNDQLAPSAFTAPGNHHASRAPGNSLQLWDAQTLWDVLWAQEWLGFITSIFRTFHDSSVLMVAHRNTQSMLWRFGGFCCSIWASMCIKRLQRPEPNSCSKLQWDSHISQQKPRTKPMLRLYLKTGMQ